LTGTVKNCNGDLCKNNCCKCDPCCNGAPYVENCDPYDPCIGLGDCADLSIGNCLLCKETKGSTNPFNEFIGCVCGILEPRCCTGCECTEGCGPGDIIDHLGLGNTMDGCCVTDDHYGCGPEENLNGWDCACDLGCWDTRV